MACPLPQQPSIRPLRTEKTEPENRENRAGDEKNIEREQDHEIARIAGLNNRSSQPCAPAGPADFPCSCETNDNIFRHTGRWARWSMCVAEGVIRGGAQQHGSWGVYKNTKKEQSYKKPNNSVRYHTPVPVPFGF